MPLQPHVLDLLAYLVERHGRLVTKKELLRALWGDRFISDGALTSCVYEARQALGESAGAERFIRTVHGRGYRFDAAVETVGVGERLGDLQEAPATAPSHQAPTTTPFSVAATEDASERLLEENPRDAAAPDRPSLRGAFVGREIELQRLRQGIEEALAERSRFYLLTGEAGIGKTRTAEELARHAAERGLRCLWGRCYEGEGAPAFWPWIQVMRAYVGEVDRDLLAAELGPAAADLGDLVPEIRRGASRVGHRSKLEPAEARFRLFDAVARLLSHAAARRPLAVVLDDVQWGDPTSLLLLEFLASQTRSSRLFVLVSYRDVELRRDHPLLSTLAELTRHGAERILLRGLTVSEVRELIVAAVGNSVPEALVDAVYRETEGNPFFVSEVVRWLTAEGRLIGEGSPGSRAALASSRLEIPQSVREVIGRRFKQVSSSCSDALRAASVLGRQFDLRVLGRIVEMDENLLLGLLEEAVVAHLVEEPGIVGGAYRFTHALIQEALYEELSAPRRAHLHQRAGVAIEHVHAARLGPYLVEIAHHLFQDVHALGVERVVAAATRAGDWAAHHHAYEQAALMYRRAVEAIDLEEAPDDRRLCELLVELARLEIAAGNRDAMYREGRRAMEIALRLADYDLLARAAVVMYAIGGPVYSAGGGVDQDAVARLEEVLEHLDATSPLRARLLLALALQLNFTRQHERRRRLRDEARSIAVRLTDDELLFDATTGVAHAAEATSSSSLSTDHRIEELLPVAEEAVGIAVGVGKPEQLFALGIRCTMRLVEGDWSGMLEDFDALTRLAPEVRTFQARQLPLQLTAVRAAMSGRWDEAIRIAAEARELAGGRQIGEHVWVLNHFASRLHRGGLGKSERAFSGLARNDEFLLPRGFLARISAAEGATPQLREHFEILAANDFGNLPMGIARTNTLCHSADACAALGDTARALRLYELMQPYAEYHSAIGTPIVTAYLGSFEMRLGRLAALLGERSTADAHFRAAARWAEGAEALPWLAWIRLERGRLLLEAGFSDGGEQARAELAAARSLGERLGMAPLLEQLDLVEGGASPTMSRASRA